MGGGRGEGVEGEKDVGVQWCEGIIIANACFAEGPRKFANLATWRIRVGTILFADNIFAKFYQSLDAASAGYSKTVGVTTTFG